MNFKTILGNIFTVLFFISIAQATMAQEPPNPVAIADYDAHVRYGPQRSYVLDAFNSFDQHGTIVSWYWQIVNVTTTASNPPADFPFYSNIANPQDEQTSAIFTNPWIDEQIVYELQLAVFSVNENTNHPYVDTQTFYIDGTCNGPNCVSYNN